MFLALTKTRYLVYNIYCMIICKSMQGSVILAKAKAQYDNTSIQKLEGPDRVRKRPGVIFGSDGLDGCEHSVFEIISNSIDEAREGHGKKIVITYHSDNSI